MISGFYFLNGMFPNGIIILVALKHSIIESASSLHNKHMDQHAYYHEWVPWW
jgi:hypothetical protein